MTLTNSSKNATERLPPEGSFDLSGAQSAIKTKEVSDKTGNVRCGHRSPGKESNRSVVEGRRDVGTRSPEVDAGPEVRERSLGVGNGGGGDGDCFLDTSRRNIDNVLVLVPGGNDNRDAGVKELEEEQEIRTDERFDLSGESYSDHGVVDGIRDTASKAQRGNGGGSSAFEVRGDEVEARDAVNGKRTHISTLCPAQLRAQALTYRSFDRHLHHRGP